MDEAALKFAHESRISEKRVSYLSLQEDWPVSVIPCGNLDCHTVGVVPVIVIPLDHQLASRSIQAGVAQLADARRSGGRHQADRAGSESVEFGRDVEFRKFSHQYQFSVWVRLLEETANRLGQEAVDVELGLARQADGGNERF